MTRIRFTGGSSIEDTELEFRVSRSSGPGGQGVNTTDSKVELRWDVEASQLHEGAKVRIRDRMGHRMTKDGILVIQASEERSQHQNKAAAIQRFRSLVGEAMTPPKRRRPTKPTRGSQRRRIEAKKQRGELKQQRRKPQE
ncbi:MAG: ribosome-associated protein [Myxococcota bacterium]|jgi:ribosome-associated protein